METIHQEFQVSFRYPVHFTTGLTRGILLLHQVIRDGGGGLPKKLLAVVDRGLLQHHPGLFWRLWRVTARSTGKHGLERCAPGFLVVRR